MIAGDNTFVDTNIVLYRASGIPAEKQAAASKWMNALWLKQKGHVSWQVIHEFYSMAVTKLKIPPATARATVNELVLWSPQPPTHSTIQRAWHWCDSARINFWDALIVAAAEQAGCRWLLSEDFQEGRRFASVTVINPFAHEPSELDLA